MRITETEHMLMDTARDKEGADDVVDNLNNMTMNDFTEMFLDAEEGEVMQTFREQLDE